MLGSFPKPVWCVHWRSAVFAGLSLRRHESSRLGWPWYVESTAFDAGERRLDIPSELRGRRHLRLRGRGLQSVRHGPQGVAAPQLLPVPKPTCLSPRGVRYLPARSTKSFTKYRASECAGRIGHFASIHEAIYAHSDSSYTWKWHDWLDELEVGERMNQFRTCMADTSGLSAIHRDTMDANELGLIGTPSYLINDLLIEGHPGFNKFVELIVELIRVAGQSK